MPPFEDEERDWPIEGGSSLPLPLLPSIERGRTNSTRLSSTLPAEIIYHGNGT
jgi:hypothetical protein